MIRYLLDTNAYFAILKYLAGEFQSSNMENVLKGECYISKLTQIEIISVIGQYARGRDRQVQRCDRVHAETGKRCDVAYVVERRKKWSRQKLHDWLKLEKDISSGISEKWKLQVLNVNNQVIDEAERFIQKALIHNFRSMDAMILGTAKAYSTNESKMVVVTADKALKAGMEKIGYPSVSFV